MTLHLDPKRKTYSARMRHRIFGRIHFALKTKVQDIAMRRHTALGMLLDTGEPVRDLVDALRREKLTIQSVEECVRAKLPFDALRASTWPTLSGSITEYTDAIEARDTGSEKTLANAVSALSHATAFFGESRRLESITHEDVAAYKAYLVGRELNPNTIGLYLTRFGALYTFLQKREARRAAHQKRQPARLFSPLDRDEHVSPFVHTRVRFLSDDEAQLVMAACPPSLAPAIAVGMLAGLRGGEICMLRRGLDVDLGSGVIRVQQRPGWQPKYGKNRDVPISSALRPYLEAASEYRDGAIYLFPGPDPKSPMLIESIRRAFYRVASDANLVTGRSESEGITLHTLRHTFASWLVMAGADLLTIARLMGHAGIGQVERTYAHLSPEHKRATVELLSSRFHEPLDTTSDTTEVSNED